MKYIHLSLSLRQSLSLKQKQEYAKKFFMGPIPYDPDARLKKGIIRQFSNAIGYLSFDDDITNLGAHVPAQNPSPEGFESPYSVLMDSAQTPMDGQTVIEFYVPMKTFVHPEKVHSYRTSDMVRRFEGFLNKVFPELESNIEEVDQVPTVSAIDFVKNNFYLSLGNIRYSIEVSLREPLEDDLLLGIIPSLQELTEFPIGIEQAECDACKHNSGGTHPYHVEITYLDWAEREATMFGDADTEPVS